MGISPTDSQERFIQAKIQAGKYRSAEEVLEIALFYVAVCTRVLP